MTDSLGETVIVRINGSKRNNRNCRRSDSKTRFPCFVD